LERIHRFCEFEFAEQRELSRQFGHVLGCPLCTLGTEVSTQEDALCRKVRAIMDQSRRYLETTIRDAHAGGLIHAPDAAAKARTVYAYTEGLMQQARIRNDLDLFREMERGILDLLGVKVAVAVTA
jgi:TetR/AcrR family transcriptional repressor of nem operon